MKYQRRSTDRISHERWLVSYADFVTLLFAFFVVMYASAQMDQKRAGRLSVAIESAFQQLGLFQTDSHKPGNVIHKPLSGSRTPASDPAVELSRLANESLGLQAASRKKEDFTALRAELEKALAGEIKRNEVALRTDQDGLVVSLREMGFFDSGSASDEAGSRGRLRPRRSDSARARAAQYGSRATPIPFPFTTQQFASNWELSTARATELVKALIEKHGVAPDRLSAAGYAEFHPGRKQCLCRRAGNSIAEWMSSSWPLPFRRRCCPIRQPRAPARNSRTSHPASVIHEPAANPSASGKTG